MYSTNVGLAGMASFDTNPYKIGINNRALACISHKASDFEGALMDSPRVIKGIAGTRVTKIKQGTLKWRWDDDDGKTHTFLIPQSYFVPTGGVKLLSPQHWAQHLRSKPKREGVTTTYKDKVVVTWQGCTKTVQLDDKTNIALFFLSLGFTKVPGLLRRTWRR